VFRTPLATALVTSTGLAAAWIFVTDSLDYGTASLRDAPSQGGRHKNGYIMQKMLINMSIHASERHRLLS
jgi:hypothetical protein